MIERSLVLVPAGAAGEFSSLWSTFCADSYFGILSTPVLPQWHVKDPGHFCQKCRWQVTAKQTCTLRMWLCMMGCGMVHGCMVHRTCARSSFTWLQPCDTRITLQVNHFSRSSKARYKRIQSLIQSHTR